MARVKRDEFLNTLNLVDAGLSPRPFIEQSSCYIFDYGWVSTFNDEICCRAKSRLPKDFTGAVQAKPLKTVLDAMSDEEIDLRPDGKELIIRANGKEIALRLEGEIVLPVDEVVLPEDDEFTPLPENFKYAVEKVVSAAGTSDEEFITLCVHVHPKHLEASDRRQMCRYTFKTGTGVKDPFLVRAKSLTHVIKVDPTKIGQTDEWVHFRNANVFFSCRRHREDYFKLDEQFDFTGSKMTLPQGGVEAVKIAATFLDGKEEDKVTVTLSPESDERGMLVSGQGPMGRATVPLHMRYKGKPQSFRVLPNMLAQLIKDNKECEIGPRKLCVRGDGWVYVTSLASAEKKKEAARERETVPAGPTEDEDNGPGDADD